MMSKALWFWTLKVCKH